MSGKPNELTGLFFGSFNPIHIGHLIIGNYLTEYCDIKEVWFVITPHNPFKQKRNLLDNNHRYQLVYEAVTNYPKLKASDIEFGLPQPNYTVHTMAHLFEKYPQKNFALIMGEDNLLSLHRWKNYELLLKNPIYIYPRITESLNSSRLKNHNSILRVKAPIIEISSTAVREGIKEGKNIRPLLPDAVWKYIDEMNFYK